MHSADSSLLPYLCIFCFPFVKKYCTIKALRRFYRRSPTSNGFVRYQPYKQSTNMKKNLIATVAVTAGMLAASAPAATVDFGVDVKNAYVASGVTCNNSAVAQPWIGIGDLKVGDVSLPLSLGVWGNIDLGKYTADPTLKSGRFSEIDFNIDLDLAAAFGLDENLTLMIGYLEYDYPRSGADQDNVFVAKVGYDFGFFNTYVISKYRFGGSSEGKWEIFAGAGKDLTLATIADTDLSLGLNAEVLYTDNNIDGAPHEHGFTCADLSASLGYGIGYVKAEYIARMEDSMLPTGDFGYDVKWIFSAGVAYTF